MHGLLLYNIYLLYYITFNCAIFAYYIEAEYFYVSQHNNILFHSDCKDG